MCETKQPILINCWQQCKGMWENLEGERIKKERKQSKNL